VFFTEYCYGDKSKEYEVGGTCVTHGEGRGVYRVFVGKLEGKRPLGRPRHRWKYNIKIDFRETGIDGTKWIRLVAQDRVWWRAFLNAVMNLRAP
jgi:hypothetical protein